MIDKSCCRADPFVSTWRIALTNNFNMEMSARMDFKSRAGGVVDKSGGRSQHQSCHRVRGERVWQMAWLTISSQALNLPLQYVRGQSFIYSTTAQCAHPFLLVWMSLEFPWILRSVLVKYFCWVVSRLQTESFVWNLHHQRAVLGCLLRTPINASVLHLFLSSHSCWNCMIMSSLFEREGRTQMWTESSFRNR